MENSTLMANISTEAAPALLTYAVPPQWSQNVEVILMLIVFVCGVPGNALILCVQGNNGNKTSTDYLVMIMAMYELVGSSLNALVKIAFNIDALWLIVTSPFICKLNQSAYRFAQFGSSQTLGLVAVDRCIKTMLPFNRWYTEKTAQALSVGILFVTLALSLPASALQSWDPVPLLCAVSFDNFMLSKYFGIAASIMMAAVFCVMSVSYGLIAVFLKRRHLAKLGRRRKHRDTGVTVTEPSSSMPTEDMASTFTSAVVVISSPSEVSANGVDGQANNSDGCVVHKVDGQNQTSQQINEQSKGKGQTRKAKAQRVLTLEGRNVNKLTILMFSISLVYVATNLIQWYLFMTSIFALGIGVLQLSYSIPMLNCIANPVIFMLMSSRFRQNAKTLICCGSK